jgi:phage terminase large subunit
MIEELKLDVPTPRAFIPLLGSHRFKGAKGGRGGAKSHFYGALSVEEMWTQHTRLACVREVQNSIKDSVKQLIEDKINKLQAVDPENGKRYPIAPWFRITDREIICQKNDSLAIFRGLQNHTATSIKSLEGFTRAWYEESQSLSKRSTELAIPTFRTPGSQQWFSWNPDLENDPVDVLFRENADDPDFQCIHVNYDQNPWFPDELRRDMERDRLRDPDKYEHVWLGGYRKNSEARVFRNWKVERFEPPAGVKFYLGADWGFSVDPTVLLCCYIVGRTLYIWREVWAIGCEIDRTPALFDKIDPEWTPERAKDPDWRSLARRLPITADSARPETISYMKRNGFPLMQPAIKGPGSVEDGVEFVKSYDVIIHPDCRHTVDEFTLFSYVIDKKTGEITNKLDEKKNHTIDSARYALENVRRARHSSTTEFRL